ncbi:MAG: histidine kinase dimerization/phospho-acceptor domain-containing protein [Peptococcaceae bacterium]|nr:histidine kinase dimerization/phospho-acceptor domain-containing protein [Peptococcaceae bacterium]
MDTKSKKWKIIASFTAFFFGVSLLFHGGLTLFSLFCGGSAAWRQAGDAFQSDYQETAEFRQAMSEYLADFLAMATGGPVGERGVHYSYSAAEAYGTAESAAAESYPLYEAIPGAGTKIEEMIIQREAVTEDRGYGYEGETPTVAAPEVEMSSPADPLQAAKSAHDYYKEDKNVLYSIAYENQVKYTNAGGLTLNGAAGILPEGYNFLLYFDGTSVKIIKDGKEVDVYGDGYYRDAGGWYVPGYKNFTVDDETAKASVTIAALSSPMIYVKGNYSSSWDERQYNRLYWLEYNQKQQRDHYLSSALSLLAGCLLTGLYVYLRKEKQAADRFLAAAGGRIWFEVKLAVLLNVLALFFSGFGYGIRETFYLLSRSGFRQGDWWILTEYFNGLSSNRGALLVLFWTAYLFINDLRYNDRPWRNSLCSRALAAVRTREMKLPVQRRMVGRCRTWFVMSLILAAAAGVSVIFAGEYYDYGSFWPAALVLALIAGLAWFQYAFVRNNKEVAEDIGALTEQIAAVKSGGLTQGLSLPADADLAQAARDLNEIQQGLRTALAEQTKSERLKVELIANVSHDIKTPLTSIISYVDLLDQEEGLPEHVKDYIKILSGKAERLKTMVQDVFEVSKAASGQLPVRQEILDLGKLLRQTLADMAEPIAAGSVRVKTEIPGEPVMISADGQRLYRVFQNLLQNALQYSLEGSRVFVTLTRNEGRAVACVKNISKSELEAGLDFTQRFVRGDQSRSDGGSGLGLSIASSFTEACGGSFRVESFADLFVATVEFQEIRP